MLYHHKTHNVYIDNSYPVSKNKQKDAFLLENVYINIKIKQLTKLKNWVWVILSQSCVVTV